MHLGGKKRERERKTPAPLRLLRLVSPSAMCDGVCVSSVVVVLVGAD